MFRLSGFLFIFIAVFCAVLLFQTSQSVQSLEGDLAEIVEINQREKDNIRVLSTEWDYLNSPQNLEKLIGGHDVVPLKHGASNSNQDSQGAVVITPKHKPAFIRYSEGEE